MHSREFVHRDIKPENFLIGTGKKANMVFVIDFGLSKRYKCPKTGKHIEPKRKHGVTGTPRYCSKSCYMKNEHSRRDDMESIGNICIFLAKKGVLPWMEGEEIENRKQSREV